MGIFLSQVSLLQSFSVTEILAILVTFLTTLGGGVFAFYKFLVLSKTEAKNNELLQIRQFYSDLMSDHNNLRQEYNAQKTQLIFLEVKVKQLEMELDFFRSNKLAVQSKDMLKHIFNARSNACFLFDIGTNFWYINNSFCNLFNIESVDFWSPINLLAAYNDIDRASKMMSFLEVVNIGVPITKEVEYNKYILNPNSPYRIKCLVRKVPLKIQDNNYIFCEILEVLEDNIPN